MENDPINIFHLLERRKNSVMYQPLKHKVLLLQGLLKSETRSFKKIRSLKASSGKKISFSLYSNSKIYFDNYSKVYNINGDYLYSLSEHLENHDSPIVSSKEAFLDMLRFQNYTIFITSYNRLLILENEKLIKKISLTCEKFKKEFVHLKWSKYGEMFTISSIKKSFKLLHFSLKYLYDSVTSKKTIELKLINKIKLDVSNPSEKISSLDINNGLLFVHLKQNYNVKVYDLKLIKQRDTLVGEGVTVLDQEDYDFFSMSFGSPLIEAKYFEGFIDYPVAAIFEKNKKDSLLTCTDISSKRVLGILRLYEDDWLYLNFDNRQRVGIISENNLSVYEVSYSKRHRGFRINNVFSQSNNFKLQKKKVKNRFGRITGRLCYDDRQFYDFNYDNVSQYGAFMLSSDIVIMNETFDKKIKEFSLEYGKKDLKMNNEIILEGCFFLHFFGGNNLSNLHIYKCVEKNEEENAFFK